MPESPRSRRRGRPAPPRRPLTFQYKAGTREKRHRAEPNSVYDRVENADIEPGSDATPGQVALDETVIQVDDNRHWFVAAVDPATNDHLHVRLFQTLATELAVGFLRELGEKHGVDRAEFLIDGPTT